MSTTCIVQCVTDGMLLRREALPAEDQDSLELLVINQLKRHLPPNCRQLTVRVEVDFLIEMPLLAEWKTEARVTEEKVAAPSTNPPPAGMASSNPPGSYLVSRIGSSGWTITNFQCPHCSKFYRDRTEITHGICLDEYWKLWRHLAQGQDNAERLVTKVLAAAGEKKEAS